MCIRDRGNSFPSRVAGGLVTTAGTPELATHSMEDYERVALELALDPEKLAAVKQKIADTARQNFSLFDTEGFCLKLEAIYTAMWRAAELQGAHDALSPVRTTY